MSINDKVIIITGAARGLGRDYARLAAAEGATVVIADKLEELAEATAADIRAAGGLAAAVRLDVTDLASAEAMVAQVLEQFGRIDALINNAAIWQDNQRFALLETPGDYWDSVMNVNVRGVLYCVQAVAPHMKQRQSGRIINISSIGAYQRGVAYSVSKLAVHQLTFSLAGELGPFNVTVNAVGPGPTFNEATQAQISQAQFDQLVARLCIKRGGKSEDMYSAIRWLLADDANWVTGQCIMVDGGLQSRL
jgi:3-oxoacyl-[acyl-carrier protein] reductase